MSFEVDAFLERRDADGWNCLARDLHLIRNDELNAVLFGWKKSPLSERFHLAPRPLPGDRSIEVTMHAAEFPARDVPRQVVDPRETWSLYRQMSKAYDQSVVNRSGLPDFLEEVSRAVLKAEGKVPMLSVSPAWMRSRARGKPHHGFKMSGAEIRSICERDDLRVILFYRREDR